jgi:RNA polymerase primary sigma factor
MSRQGAGLTARGHRESRRHSQADEDLDTLTLYLDQIGSTPLLSAEQEVELAKRIEAGVYAERLLVESGAEQLPVTRQRELEQVVVDGQAAKDHMVRANLRLVVSIARKYPGWDGAFLDSVQEGSLGLIRAVEKFDFTRGYKFSTYATWWIRQAILRSRGQLRTVRLPVHVIDELARLTRIERTLSRTYGREPTIEEVAAQIGCPTERVVELRHLNRAPVSLDAPVGDDAASHLGDLVEEAGALTAAEISEHNALVAQLRSLVNSLPERQATVLTLRYGLRDGKQRTLEEIATRLGLPRERVRQLEIQALATLRDPQSGAPLLAWAG